MTFAPAASDLASFPVNLVEATSTVIQGRPCVRVTPQTGLTAADLIDKPSFVVVPALLQDGVIEVDLCARLRPDAPDFARAFAGLAFRIAADISQFEAIYLRPLNGLSLAPPPPRDKRAVQYFAYPDWDFQTLRDACPDGRFEAPADIRPDIWHHLRLMVSGDQITAQVDGVQVLQVRSSVASRAGNIGLWVDIGTEAFFRNFRATPASPHIPAR